MLYSPLVSASSDSILNLRPTGWLVSFPSGTINFVMAIHFHPNIEYLPAKNIIYAITLQQESQTFFNGWRFRLE